MDKFSPDFLLGAATAAHQVEGNNDNSDCWAMEQMEHTSFIEPSLDAVDHYHRYQEDIRLKGHAIECRINAENPEKNFMPCPGTVKDLHFPGGNGVRIESALYNGYTIPSFYDSMVAKVIVHGEDREDAIRKMRSALGEVVVMELPPTWIFSMIF